LTTNLIIVILLELTTTVNVFFIYIDDPLVVIRLSIIFLLMAQFFNHALVENLLIDNPLVDNNLVDCLLVDDSLINNLLVNYSSTRKTPPSRGFCGTSPKIFSLLHLKWRQEAKVFSGGFWSV
jgi:hypothetical protein